MYSSHTAHSFSLNEQQASMQMVSISLLTSSCSFQKSSLERTYSSTSIKYLPTVVMVYVSYSSLSSLIHLYSSSRCVFAVQKSSFHMRQFALWMWMSMQVGSIFYPFCIAYTHFPSAYFSSSRSVRHTQAMLAQAMAISRLISLYGAVALKGFLRHAIALSMPFQKVWMDLTPWQISASSMQRLQVPEGTSLIDLSRICCAFFSFWVVLRRLAQHIVSTSSWGFLLQAREQKYSASSQSSDSYFSSAIWKRVSKGSSQKDLRDINNNQLYNVNSAYRKQSTDQFISIHRLHLVIPTELRLEDVDSLG